jgi:hypothetical protein
LDLQILNELEHGLHVEGLEEIRLIKDKRTGMFLYYAERASLTSVFEGQSRQFAFAQFVGIPEARRFLDKFYPYISLYGAYNPSRSRDTEATKVHIAFSRDKDDRDKPGKAEDDWKCEVVGSTIGFQYISTDEQTVLSCKLFPSNVMFPMQCPKNS